MKKTIQFLMAITLIIYINNFVFAYVNGYKTLTGVAAVWALSPFLLLTISSFILADDYKKQFSIFKKEAIVGFSIKIIACIIAFYNYKFEVGSFEYIMRFVFLFVLFIVNIIIELKMYAKAKKYPSNIEQDVLETVTESEKWNFKNSGRAITLGMTSFLLVCVCGMNITFIAQIEKGYAWACVCGFIVFLKMNYDKNTLYYNDKVLGRRIFLRDAIYATIGFGFNFLIAFDLISLYEFIENIAFLIGIFFLYPTITTNRRIGLKQRAIMKAIGDNFDYYYDDENNPHK